VPGSALPRVTRLFLAGNAVAMTGNGLVIAFTLIYLHQARGIALPVVGLLLAAGAAAGLLAVTVSGVLLDRLGARRVLTGIILGQATAQVLLAWAHNAATALPALLLYGATCRTPRSGSARYSEPPSRTCIIPGLSRPCSWPTPYRA
jgi:predicted MFS family arabinose efflux permease